MQVSAHVFGIAVPVPLSTSGMPLLACLPPTIPHEPPVLSNPPVDPSEEAQICLRDTILCAPFSIATPFQVDPTIKLPSIFFDEVLASYKQWNYARADFTPLCKAEKEARKIKPKHVNSFDMHSPERIANSKLIQKKIDLMKKAAEHYEHKADMCPFLPASDRAILYSQARSALPQDEVNGMKVENYEDIQKTSDLLSCKEAEALHQAAEESNNPQEELKFLQMGLQTIPSLPRYYKEGDAPFPPVSNKTLMQGYSVGIKLWNSLSHLVMRDDFEFDRSTIHEEFNDMHINGQDYQSPKEYFAAQCMMNAGLLAREHALESLGANSYNPHELAWKTRFLDSQRYYKQARDLFKKVNLPPEVELSIGPHLEATIYEASFAIFDMEHQHNVHTKSRKVASRAEAVVQGKKVIVYYGTAAAMSEGKVKAANLIIQSKFLARIGYLTTDLPEQYELFDRAVSAAESAYTINPRLCSAPMQYYSCGEGYLRDIKKVRAKVKVERDKYLTSLGLWKVLNFVNSYMPWG